MLLAGRQRARAGRQPSPGVPSRVPVPPGAHAISILLLFFFFLYRPACPRRRTHLPGLPLAFATHCTSTAVPPTERFSVFAVAAGTKDLQPSRHVVTKMSRAKRSPDRPTLQEARSTAYSFPSSAVVRARLHGARGCCCSKTTDSVQQKNAAWHLAMRMTTVHAACWLPG